MYARLISPREICADGLFTKGRVNEGVYICVIFTNRRKSRRVVLTMHRGRALGELGGCYA